jgi:hypothetical protein
VAQELAVVEATEVLVTGNMPEMEVVFAVDHQPVSRLNLALSSINWDVRIDPLIINFKFYRQFIIDSNTMNNIPYLAPS